MSVVAVLVASGLSVLATVAVLTTWVRVRYARRLPFFRCRIGPPPRPLRRGEARWCRRRTWATWVGDVLMIRSGPFRLWLTPLRVEVLREVTVEILDRGEVRGLGRRPAAMRFALPSGGDVEVAVAAKDVDRLVGPFLTAALAGLPEARHEPGG
jgi:hypothetical protein